MWICADYLHIPHEQFAALSHEERTKWRLFTVDRWNRERELRKKAIQKATAKRKKH